MSSTRDTDSKPQRQFDVRTVERNIKKGHVTRKDYEKHLKALPDVAEKVAPADEDLTDDLDEMDEVDEADEPATTAAPSE
jgi:hypothetical protein